MKLPRFQDWSGEKLLNLAQTLGIIAAVSVSVWTVHVQRVAKSAELTLNLSQALDSGQAKVVSMALDMNGNLDKTKVSDEEIEEFLDHYEDVAMAYRHGLIDRDMANDAFSYDLEKALRDTKIRRFLSDAIGAEADLYDGVFGLARDFGISFPPIVPTKPAASVTP
jgi:hypothetical protein